MPDEAVAQELLIKYRALRRLRSISGVELVCGMKEIAGAYPGALRALDRLPTEVLEARCVELEAAADGVAPLAIWMKVEWLYHSFMRSALALRAGASCVDMPPNFIDRMKRPPGGRMHPMVVDFVASELSLEPAEVEAQLTREFIAR